MTEQPTSPGAAGAARRATELAGLGVRPQQSRKVEDDVAALAESQAVMQRTIALQHQQYEQLLARYTALERQVRELRARDNDLTAAGT